MTASSSSALAAAAPTGGTSDGGPLSLKAYTYQSGAVYEGTFKGTKRHGQGHWRHPEGEVYEGEYSENKQHGFGVYIFGNTGKRYYGQWENGEMSGEGIYYFGARQQTYYVGGYKHDKKHGDGYYMYENGVMTVQKWAGGDLQAETDASPSQRIECAYKLRELFSKVRAVAPKELGEVPQRLDVKTFRFPSGATYSGQFSGTKKHGQGYWLHPEGDSYEGTFEDNRHSGWGVYVTGKSGKKYVGQWGDGKMNGWGVYFFNPQETEFYVGMYKDDRKDGPGLYRFAETGLSKSQVWANGEVVKAVDADPPTVISYLAAIRKIIELTAPFAPHYHSVGFA